MEDGPLLQLIMPSFLFLFYLKTPENQRWYKIGRLARNKSQNIVPTIQTLYFKCLEDLGIGNIYPIFCHLFVDRTEI